METNRIVSLLTHFSIPDREYSYESSSSGFIHTSYFISTAGEPQYVLQKFNTTIFQDPQAVYFNFKQITPYLTSPSYEHFEWILTKDQLAYYKDGEGQLWRLLSYVSDSVELRAIHTPKEAFECGKLLGRFHKQLESADPHKLQVPIPGFHDVHLRWKDLEHAIQTGIPQRIKAIRAKMKKFDWLREYVMQKPVDLRLRVCHNDTKLSNILFHKDTNTGLCFVDLDTLMPGYLFHDFGDLARTVLAPHAEDTDKIHPQVINEELLIALLNGIRDSGLPIQEKEVASLTYGLITLPFLHGIRALTDYLLGDQYYSVSHPEQNRNRALNLLGFAQSCFLKKEELDLQIHEILSTST